MDDSDIIKLLDDLVNRDEGISLKKLKQFKKNKLDPALAELETLKTFRINAIAKYAELEARLDALEGT